MSSRLNLLNPKKCVSIPDIFIFYNVLAKLFLYDGKFVCWGAIYQTFTISGSKTLSGEIKGR